MTAKKKPTVGKAGAEKKPNDPKDTLARELKNLIPRLDAVGLQFLIEQAQVHLYNMQVNELNRTMERSLAAKTTAGKKSKSGKAQYTLMIEGTPGGNSFYLYYNGQSVVFNKNEIIAMVNIACAALTKPEIQENLLMWFTRERRDIFSTIPINDKFDERLGKIAALLKKNFRVRK